MGIHGVGKSNLIREFSRHAVIPDTAREVFAKRLGSVTICSGEAPGRPERIRYLHEHVLHDIPGG